MKTVHEVSELVGVSVRTLHHYDAIGLLKPARVTEAGYRLYDDTALERLQTILLFRELEFPLREIAEILKSPDFDRGQALRQQLGLLELRRARLDGIIELTRQMITTGENNMSFKEFDKSELERYEKEAKARWGKTDAYREYEEKAKNQSEGDAASAAKSLMALFAELGAQRALSPSDAAVQATIDRLRRCITDNYYNCTKEIFRGLGAMYSAGGEMTENIDKAGGEGTARFATAAIEIYCGKAE